MKDNADLIDQLMMYEAMHETVWSRAPYCSDSVAYAMQLCQEIHHPLKDYRHP